MRWANVSSLFLVLCSLCCSVASVVRICRGRRAEVRGQDSLVTLKRAEVGLNPGVLCQVAGDERLRVVFVLFALE